MNRKYVLLIIGLLAVGFILGRSCARDGGPSAMRSEASVPVDFWTCAMHPQVHENEPGKCPFCGMDLIPVSGDTDGAELGPRELRMSARAERLAEVETVSVERKFAESKIRLVGQVDFDETRLAYITARVPGRLDRLYVDYTGVKVNKGDHLVYLYSPELLAAQAELIQALETARKLRDSDISIIRDRTQDTVRAAREKLRLYGFTAGQIDRVEKKRASEDHIAIYSPISGIVIHKNVLEGAYVDTGTRIYTIADLSHVWVKLEVYESDLSWLHYGQSITFEAEAYPGDVFNGRISFIDPVLDTSTRTVKVRVNVDNADGRLKPGMFVRAVVRSKVAQGGNVFSTYLAGKWICPMHPEIVKDEAGDCDICGMDLVGADSLGYVTVSTEEAPLVIPASAALITGKRAVVYVKDPERLGVYEGRDIVLGPRAGDYYIVKKGLEEGELVVTRGNFKIDSAVQILAKPSMMNPEGGETAPVHQPGSGGKHEGIQSKQDL